jgi:hypothetical protein
LPLFNAFAYFLFKQPFTPPLFGFISDFLQSLSFFKNKLVNKDSAEGKKINNSKRELKLKNLICKCIA